MAAKSPAGMGGGGGGTASVTVTSGPLVASSGGPTRSRPRMPSLRGPPPEADLAPAGSGRLRHAVRWSGRPRGLLEPARMLGLCPARAAEHRSRRGRGSAPRAAMRCTAGRDERRIATVLFADLVGFTTLSETRDPEQVKNLVDACFQLLARDITSFGGQVDKIVGDAIVALFGAPVAHEDDAERAVRAALRMQETVQAYRDRDRRPGAAAHRRQHRRGAGRRAARRRRLHGHGRRGEHRAAAPDRGRARRRSWSVRPPTPPPTSRSPTSRSARSRSRAATSRSRPGRPSRRCCLRATARTGRRPRSSGATPRWACSATPSTRPSSGAARTCSC